MNSFTHCRKSHPYSGSNLYIHPRNRWRGCKQCRRDAFRKAHKKLNMDIVERLQIPIATREEIPKTFTRLTRPIKVNSESDIIESIWSTLQFAPVMATMSEGYLVFWRRCITPIPPSKQHAGYVQTRDRKCA